MYTYSVIILYISNLQMEDEMEHQLAYPPYEKLWNSLINAYWWLYENPRMVTILWSSYLSNTW